MNIRLSTIFIALLCLQCSDIEQPHFVRKSYDGQPNREQFVGKEEVNLKGRTVISFPEIKIPGDLEILGDSLIVLDLIADTTVNIFNTNNYQLITKLAPKGYGPGEMMAPFFISSLGEKFGFLVHDIQLNKINIFSANSIAPTQISSSNKIYHPFYRKEIGFVSLSRSGKGRLAYFDTLGNVFHKGLIPSLMDKEVPPAERVSAFEGSLSINQNSTRLVVTSELADVIHIYDESGNILSEIKGPEFFEPIYESNQVNDDWYLISRKMESRYGFVDVYAGATQFYVLYSGITNEESLQTSNQGKTIFCFDYQGVMVKKFNLDKKILKFAVDEKNKRIFAGDVNSENPGVVVFDYSDISMQH